MCLVNTSDLVQLIPARARSRWWGGNVVVNVLHGCVFARCAYTAPMHNVGKYRLPYAIAGVLAVILVALISVWLLGAKTSNGPIGTLPDTQASSTLPVVVPVQGVAYLEVVDGCNHAYEGTCVNMRSAPNKEASVVERLRTGVVLRVAGTVKVDGKDWYKVLVDEHIQYPERVKGDWYVYADAVELFYDEGDKNLTSNTATTTKNIYVNLTEEMLYAYDGDVLFMQEPISTGLELTPTPAGTFRVFRKTPSRYMQGPLPGVSSQVYDLPGVPWNLYFTNEGAVIHGAYWHDSFGKPWSHGCVNLAPQSAKKLYDWADTGTLVVVQH